MKILTNKTGFSLTLLSMLFAGVASASSWSESEELARLIKHLDAAESIVAKAEFESDKNKRLQFDYEALRNNLEMIKSGVKQHLNKPLEPRDFKEIKSVFSKYKRSDN